MATQLDRTSIEKPGRGGDVLIAMGKALAGRGDVTTPFEVGGSRMPA
jgi:hypothetical protein